MSDTVIRVQQVHRAVFASRDCHVRIWPRLNRKYHHPSRAEIHVVAFKRRVIRPIAAGRREHRLHGFQIGRQFYDALRDSKRRVVGRAGGIGISRDYEQTAGVIDGDAVA